MQKLVDLTENIKVIRDLAKDVLKKYIRYMKDVTSEESKIMKKLKDINLPENANEQILEIIDKSVEDADSILTELEMFSELVANGKLGKEGMAEKCPYMASVWFGDMYGVKGIEALVMLRSELEEEITKAGKKVFLEHIRSIFVQ